ncbi:MAG TPA: murein biosynthesis integral membrane protein MurJ, partial [Candidatus Moranbacteria bacterium]|nr:murein biosynthesis integral membrane protein MurJ [Candidatus Moranbacteria bacterium]
MIKRIFNNGILNGKPAQSVTAAAFIITVAGLASRTLGLLRDRFLASTFGAGDTLDVYYAAFRIPDLIYNLLILGALSAAFIPVFTGLISKDQKEDAWKAANGILNLSIFFIIIVSLILAVFAPYLMKVITPGFPAEKMEMVVSFTRIMFLSPLFLGISGIFGGILTSYKRFLIYSIAPILYNLGIIFGVLVLVRFMGPIGLAWGVVLGAFLHM